MLLNRRYIPFSEIKGIIHVGAHEAEELELYTASGISQVLWIEANPSLQEIVRAKIGSHPYMQLGMFAAGEKAGEAILNIANNTQSSSLLELGTHSSSYPDIYYRSKIKVRLDTVDNWISENYFRREQYNFINLDIQGSELQALQGLIKQLPYVDFVYTEVNFKQVYKNCSTVEALDDFLRQYELSRRITCRTPEGWGDALYSKKPFHLRKNLFKLEDFCATNIRYMKNLVKKLVYTVTDRDRR